MADGSLLQVALGFWQAGGPVMYVLLAIGIAMAAISGERAWFLCGPGCHAWQREVRLRLSADPNPVWQSAAITEGIGGLKFMHALVAMAPLVGLLGTVSGMLITFANLGSSGAHSVACWRRGSWYWSGNDYDPGWISAGFTRFIDVTRADSPRRGAGCSCQCAGSSPSFNGHVAKH